MYCLRRLGYFGSRQRGGKHVLHDDIGFGDFRFLDSLFQRFFRYGGLDLRFHRHRSLDLRIRRLLFLGSFCGSRTLDRQTRLHRHEIL